MTYTPPDVVADETTAIEGSLAGIANRIPGWVPSDNSPETIIAEPVGIAIATATQAMVATAQDTYAGFGENILGIKKIEASPASTTSTWTFDTADGILIPAGIGVDLTQPSGSTVEFVVAETVTVPAGITVVTGVTLIARDAGAATNGATNPASQNELTNVVSVTADSPSSSGEDDETPDDYVNRLVKANRRGHSIPITVADYADAATDVPGVARCAAINLLDPGDPGAESPGHISLFPVDVDGQPVASDVKSAIADSFAAIETPLNVTVHIEDPSYVSFPVVAAVTADPDVDKTALQASCIAAIQALIDAATYDADQDADGGWRDPRSTRVTVFDIAAALDDLAGVRAVTAVTVNSSTSVTFTDPVTLPQLSTVPTVTVT